METNQNTATALSTDDRWPSIFEDSDNVYNTYPLPSEDPRKHHHYANTAARTPRAIRRAA